MSGAIGIVCILIFAVFLSSNRKSINLWTVIVAFGLQATLGAFALYFPVGQSIFQSLSFVISDLLEHSTAGTSFVFGDLADGSKMFYFAFQVLPVIIFFSALVSVFYYIGVMQLCIRIIGGGLRILLKTSRVESMVAATNIFLGIGEAPLVARPYIPELSRSQLFAVMVCCLSSVAGSVLAGYAAMGVSLDALIAASFMAAPGGLLMSKLMEPEIDSGANEKFSMSIGDHRHSNIFQAAADGAIAGLTLALNIGAMLIAFMGIIALLNVSLEWLASLFGIEGATIQTILGKLFQPVAFLIGVPLHESEFVGGLLGQKLVFNEFVAFMQFTELQTSLSRESQIIATFALCGFANFASIGVLLGGLGVLAPSRRAEISQLSLRALVAATLANLMSAAIAGTFMGWS